MFDLYWLEEETTELSWKFPNSSSTTQAMQQDLKAANVQAFGASALQSSLVL